jgi:hypothetical protein
MTGLSGRLWIGWVPNSASFHPEAALFRCGGVNPQVCLCGVPMYASAQTFDFLATTKNCSLPIWKRRCVHLRFRINTRWFPSGGGPFPLWRRQSAGLLVRRIAVRPPAGSRFVSRVLSVRGFVADKKPVAWGKSL